MILIYSTLPLLSHSTFLCLVIELFTLFFILSIQDLFTRYPKLSTRINFPMDIDETPDALYADRKRFFTDFFQSTDNETDYKANIKLMLQREERRLTISIDELRKYDQANQTQLANGLLNQPADFLPAAEAALTETIVAIYEPYEFNNIQLDSSTDFYLAFRGAFGSHQLTPRSIDSSYLSKMVSIEGIVTRASLVRPKIIKSVHYCDATSRFHSREYRDQTTSFNPIVTSAIYPTEDPEGNKLTTEYGFSKYRDHQTIAIQELPELAPAGQLPRAIDVVLDDDLVDKLKPGDRVQIIGVYRSLGGGQNNSSSFKVVILGNSLYPLHARSTSTKSIEKITDFDIRNINKLSKKRDIFDLLSQSLAPSIYGHEYIKKAVLLMLLSGVEKNLDNGTHLRGDINILMVGDPSTAKSQILRFVLNTAALAIATTGRGSSGVGLTAAVTTDKETGERRLEAGAMVLADRGIVCIDEFDKMSDVDRVAIHEVMEQQTITISKAGIHTSLNARCSVIAAANPIYGQYDTFKTPQQNIALPDSLLSRFDLLFIVTDDISDERDKAISEHVLRMHKYIPHGYVEGEPIRERAQITLAVGDQVLNADGSEEENVNEIFEKFNPLLHAGAAEAAALAAEEAGLDPSTAASKKPQILAISFLKKYIQYAKTRVKPVLTEKATKMIVNIYADFRNDEATKNTRTTPITARTLETLIRLSTAHAKVRLSQTVDSKDVRVAEELLRFSLFKEKMKKSRRNAVSPEEREARRVAKEAAAAAKGAHVLLTPEKKKRRINIDLLSDSEVSDFDVSEDDEDMDSEPENYIPRVSTRRQKSLYGIHEDDEDVEDLRKGMENLEGTSKSDIPLQEQTTGGNNDDSDFQISEGRLAQFKKACSEVFSESQTKEVSDWALGDFLKLVDEKMQQEESFSAAESRSALVELENKNILMVTDDRVWRI